MGIFARRLFSLKSLRVIRSGLDRILLFIDSDLLMDVRADELDGIVSKFSKSFDSDDRREDKPVVVVVVYKVSN